MSHRSGRWVWSLGRLVVALAAAVGCLPLACSDSGLVGGRCADGFTYCAPECVDLKSDALHCGTCESRCDRGEVCDDGLCASSSGTGSAGSGASSGSGGFGGGSLGGLAGSGTGSDFGTGGAGLCLPPYNKARFCGDCNTRCIAPKPFCAPDTMGGYFCRSKCNLAPFDTECSESCVDTTSDASHCGACGNECPSGICVSSVCVGATPGHLIALCHDYSLYYPNASQSTLLGNAVFMAQQNPARILAYSQYANSSVVNSTNAAIANQAAKKGRGYVLTQQKNSSTLSTQLKRTDYDVLLVYDQVSAPSGALTTLATALGPAVQDFTDRGGVVVILTGGKGASEMHLLISGLGIANVTGFTNQSMQRLYLQAPGDGLAVSVVSPYLGVQNSCAMTTTDTPTGANVFVVSETDPLVGLGSPVAIHNVIPP